MDNKEKSKPNPAETIQKIVLPEEKISNLKLRLSYLQSSRSCTVREVMSALGLMTALIPAVQWVRFHQRSLQRFLLEELKDKDLEEYIMIPTRVK